MQLQHVRYFVATVDAGSVSAAAAEMRVTQPALSRQLRQLEHDLGVGLFDRSPGRLTLSRTGRELLSVARDLLASADALQSAARYHAEGRLQRVTIAAPTVTLTDMVSPFVATMSPDDPVVDVRGADGVSTAEMLRAGADLVIGTDRPGTPYTSEPLAELPVWAYVRTDDPWLRGRRKRVPLDELLGRTLIVLPETFTAREALEVAVANRGMAYAGLVEAANGTIAQALAASGRGVAVVSDDPRYDLVPLAIDLGGEPLSIRLTAAWDPREVAATTVASIARQLQQWVGTHYG
ncbi:MAG: LysR family transcriptional regulator [Nocardioidaceae bacterium]